ncbi:MAG: hypothetical protein EOP04_04330 [Proteobacteria bacterium]|nr:MAG: hypothetical protein EOP04_04330 [Pseudomonadota bacterium]
MTNFVSEVTRADAEVTNFVSEEEFAAVQSVSGETSVPPTIPNDSSTFVTSGSSDKGVTKVTKDQAIDPAKISHNDINRRQYVLPLTNVIPFQKPGSPLRATLTEGLKNSPVYANKVNMTYKVDPPLPAELSKEVDPVHQAMAPVPPVVHQAVDEGKTSGGAMASDSNAAGSKLLVFCWTLASVILTSALVYFGWEAGGSTAEALFWALVTEIGGFILMCHPTRYWWKKVFLWVAGVGCLAIGYAVMHTNVLSETSSKVSSAQVGSDAVSVVLKDIEALENSRAEAVKQRDSFDSVKFRTKRDQAQKKIEGFDKELRELRAKEIAEKEKAKELHPVVVAQAQGWIEWARRFVLMFLNILAGHAALRELAGVRKRL